MMFMILAREGPVFFLQVVKFSPIMRVYPYLPGG